MHTTTQCGTLCSLLLFVFIIVIVAAADDDDAVVSLINTVVSLRWEMQENEYENDKDSRDLVLFPLVGYKKRKRKPKYLAQKYPYVK